MAREVNVNGDEKSLAECTAVDLDHLANGAQPSAATRKQGVSIEGNYAHLAQMLRDRGAATVGDLGPEETDRWEVALGLGYIGSESIFNPKPKADDPADAA